MSLLGIILIVVFLLLLFGGLGGGSVVPYWGYGYGYGHGGVGVVGIILIVVVVLVVMRRLWPYLPEYEQSAFRRLLPRQRVKLDATVKRPAGDRSGAPA